MGHYMRLDGSFISVDEQIETAQKEEQQRREAWTAANPIEAYAEKFPAPPEIEGLDLPPGYEIAARGYGFAVYSSFDSERGGYPTDAKIGGYSLDQGEIASADAWDRYNNQAEDEAEDEADNAWKKIRPKGRFKLEINENGAFIYPKREPLAIAQVPAAKAHELLQGLDDRTHYFEVEHRNFKIVGGRIRPYGK